MAELRGWLLDVYAAAGGLAVWWLSADGRRVRLRQDFPVRFYAAGPPAGLRALWAWLASQPERPRLQRQERRDLFAGPLPVLAAELADPAALPALFRRTAAAFPDLAFYDADLPLALRYAAVFGVFPLAFCQLELNGEQIRSVTPLDSPWELDPGLPPLRVLGLEPDRDPAHAPPQGLVLSYAGHRYRQPFEPARALLVNVRTLLERHDPDLLLTTWGDTWLLPRLLALAEQTGEKLPLNRDPETPLLRKEARSYFAYGRVIYRGAQIHLAGRWHIDTANAVMYHDYGLDGIFELARLTGLPLQTVARVSPGTGISSMQIATALRQGVLVPWRKQQAEAPKSAQDLFRTDMGGMVYQPTIGLHRDVGEIDFVSMYPSIMARFNISPETILPGQRLPESGLPATRAGRGLVPETLAPLLEKRIALKARLMTLSRWDPRRRRYQAAISAHKWLLVTCFGYLGYKNARFGRIEAHEAVTAYGRETLLRAKEAAEDLGFEVLHLYVDGMWVKKPGCATAADFQPLLEAVLERTGLPVGLDGVYRWVAFLPSRVDPRWPVANRYFGVFQSGEVKARGIELRRHDTPIFVREAQQAMLELLAEAPDAAGLPELRERLERLHARFQSQLKNGRVPLEKLVVRLTLSRTLDRYRTPSPAAVAARQLEAEGCTLRPGQTVRLLYTRGEPGVHAWDLSRPVDPATLDRQRYAVLLGRAAATLLDLFPARPPLVLFPSSGAARLPEPGPQGSGAPDMTSVLSRLVDSRG